ncbi:hypothetical protein [Nocardioides sp.]|uniref:hypothetical protein n=1 Tax=Nocardioides sp. TaxID=35761 RepID=UPI002EDA5166
MRRRALAAVVAVLGLLLAACTDGDADRRTGSPTDLLQPPDPPEAVGEQLAGVPPGKQLPLRPGEHRMTLTMPAAYTPSAPTGVGTDDYRCFLLDPGLDRDVWLTGSDVRPGNPRVVHHVILFRVPPDQVAEAERLDAGQDGEGWTCFGGSGISGDFTNIDDASWLAAWAPGGDETKVRDGYGVRLDAGSRIVMQVHYNLLQGAAPDTSSTLLRWMDGRRDLTALHTYLTPAPVEMPCRPAHDDSPLCDRDAAVADVLARFGGAGNTNNLLHLLCGTAAEPSATTSCTRTIGRPMTVLGVAGHMHLLGRSLRLEVDPDTPDARTLLDIPVWNFDDQQVRPVRPVHLEPGDTVRITCRHVQWLRDVLPAFEDSREDRYVIWAEGSTDEMCLGMLQVAFED